MIKRFLIGTVICAAWILFLVALGRMVWIVVLLEGMS